MLQNFLLYEKPNVVHYMLTLHAVLPLCQGGTCRWFPPFACWACDAARDMCMQESVQAQLVFRCVHIATLYDHSLNFWWDHALKNHNHSSVTHLKPNSVMGQAMQLSSTSIYWHLSSVNLYIYLYISKYLPTNLYCAEISVRHTVSALLYPFSSLGKDILKEEPLRKGVGGRLWALLGQELLKPSRDAGSKVTQHSVSVWRRWW